MPGLEACWSKFMPERKKTPVIDDEEIILSLTGKILAHARTLQHLASEIITVVSSGNTFEASNLLDEL